MNFVKSSIIEYASEKVNLELGTISRKVNQLNEAEKKLKEAEELLQGASTLNSKDLKDYTVSHLELDISLYKKRIVELKKLLKRKEELDELLVSLPKIKKN